ncbi:MAG: CPBP family intramembrane glutamic endopeptidase [Clostridium sp.]|uniref:CPBP family intramembrane glutamic endopeptidase n=1 Tax=Clostridium sp. TaxID=1506 RepID=UPI0039E98A50
MFKNIFINKNSQPRAGWKIAIVFIFFIILTFIAQIAVEIVYTIIQLLYHQDLLKTASDLNKSLTLSTPLGFISTILQCACMILSIVIFWRKFDKKPLRDIGLINLKDGCKDLIIGLIFGAVTLTIVFFILLVTGNVKLIAPLNRPNFNISALTGLILFIFVGINEEMFARGYCFTVLKQSTNKWIALIVSSIIFAAMHSLNSGISFLSYVNLFLFALLAMYMTIKSGNLWLSIGLHITWNYFEGNVFGFLVSGNETNGIYNVRNTADNIINGGQFGPEGGLIVTLVLILSFLFIWKFYKRKIMQ